MERKRRNSLRTPPNLVGEGAEEEKEKKEDKEGRGQRVDAVCVAMVTKNMEPGHVNSAVGNAHTCERKINVTATPTTRGSSTQCYPPRQRP
ncbi:hypothetical protein JZ751_008733 [Albula glossodonta]|uniref:Uncharacterized protein n=1 Tax=Albula glossodonta TaxID=121402 RepID=A0A8T2NZT0_9TELE|nr:hypothetical protein JZ751_008733 [Albula glossodonta]